jgi:hypothetical protein
MSLDDVRSVADAVLYEGYLLYPYRANSAKNHSRWQFGVLGPPKAAASSFGEEPGMAMQCLVAPRHLPGHVTIHLRFLQLQVREAQRLEAGEYVPVDALTLEGGAVLSWDEAVEREFHLPEQAILDPLDTMIEVPGGEDVEPVSGPGGAVVGRIVRRRWPLAARLRTTVEDDDGLLRLTVSVDNVHPSVIMDKDAAVRSSLIGAHLVLEARDADFVSLLDPPEAARAAAARCRQRRCWPVLAGPPGSSDIVLGSPIILYDHPEVAEQSPGALFDSTEIDEILSLRVMTMTDEEKAQARATDPRAAAIIDRCDDMTAPDLQQLHGILRGPLDPAQTVPTDDGVPWWDPEADASVHPDADSVVVKGTPVANGSIVCLHPSRRADAQDLFFDGQLARVTAVLSDVDGEVHVAVVLLDDPAADMHEWYGRYLYFSPDELDPMPAGSPAQREESRS